MAWEEYTNVTQNLSQNNGIVLLYAEPNFSGTSWALSGSDISIRHYFFVPARFYHLNGSFYFNFGYTFVKRPIEVYHRGVQYSEPIWVLEEAPHAQCPLLTDNATKLPYLETPSLGAFNEVNEKCYFIPVGENV